MNVEKLAVELELEPDRLLQLIRDADLGFTFDEPSAHLSPDQVAQIKHALGVLSHMMLGTWKLKSLTMRGNDVITGQTHLVVREDDIWEVWPNQVRHEGDPEPWRTYELTWPHGKDHGHLVVHGASFDRHFFVRLIGDDLHMRAGGVAGHPPASFDEDYGSLYVLEPEMDAEVIDSLKEPPPPVQQKHVEHPVLGSLAYDENLDWWTSTLQWAGVEIHFHVEADASAQVEDFDAAADILKGLDVEALKRRSAEGLLELRNDNWCEDDDEVDADGFVARMTLDAVTVGDGYVSVYFDDGDLFYGHTIQVSIEDGEVVEVGIAG